MSSFYKLRNKNKFSIFDLTRNNYTSLFIIILVIIEILLYLNKSILFCISKSFTFLNLLNKRKMFHKLTSSCYTTNPFFKSNIRLSIINFSISKTCHHISSTLSIFFIWCFSSTLLGKISSESFNKNTIFTRTIRFLIFTFYRSSYCINNSNTSKTIILFNITNSIYNTLLIKQSTFLFRLLCNTKIIIIVYDSIRNTTTLNFFSSL